MTAQGIVDDLAEARCELGDAIWEWLHIMASEWDDGSRFDDEGVYTLWWDGQVSPSAVHAVPFLVRLAVAEVYTAELFWVLGEIGRRTRGRRGAKAVAAHRAVLEQVPGLLEFVWTSRDERVRRHLLRLAACGPAQDVLPAVRALCDDPDLDDTTWAEALRAWLFLEPDKALPLAAKAVKEGSATVKILTVTALAESGAKWRPRYGRAFAACYDIYCASYDPALDDPLRTTIDSLVSRGHRKEAVRLLVSLLSPDRSRSTSEIALALAEKLAKRRKARAALLPAVLPLLATRHRHPAEDAVSFVERFGRKNTEAIDALATLASTPAFPGSQQALAMLIEKGDVRVTALLTVHIAELAKPQPRKDIEWDYQSVFWKLTERQPTFDILLLDAIRTWMQTWPREPDWRDEPGGPKNTILDLLAHWGSAAHDAAPELLDILPNHYLKALPTLRAIARNEQDHAQIDTISQ